jgi:hypothetical protein
MRYDLRVVMGVLKFALDRFNPKDPECFRIDYNDDSGRFDDFMNICQKSLSEDRLVRFDPALVIDLQQYEQFDPLVDLTIAMINEKARLHNFTLFSANAWTKLTKNVISNADFIDESLLPELAELSFELKKIQSEWLKSLKDKQQLKEHKLTTDQIKRAVWVWYIFLNQVLFKRPVVVQIIHTYFHLVKQAVAAQNELDEDTKVTISGLAVYISPTLILGLSLEFSKNRLNDFYFFKEITGALLTSKKYDRPFSPVYYQMGVKPSTFKITKEKKPSTEDKEPELSLSSSPTDRKELFRRALSESELAKDSSPLIIRKKQKQKKKEEDIDKLSERLAKLMSDADQQEAMPSVLPKLQTALYFSSGEDEEGDKDAGEELIQMKKEKKSRTPKRKVTKK